MLLKGLLPIFDNKDVRIDIDLIFRSIEVYSISIRGYLQSQILLVLLILNMWSINCKNEFDSGGVIHGI